MAPSDSHRAACVGAEPSGAADGPPALHPKGNQGRAVQRVLRARTPRSARRETLPRLTATTPANLPRPLLLTGYADLRYSSPIGRSSPRNQIEVAKERREPCAAYPFRAGLCYRRFRPLCPRSVRSVSVRHSKKAYTEIAARLRHNQMLDRAGLAEISPAVKATR